MDMTPQTAWLIAISAVVIVGVVAFFIGRSTAGTKARIEELETELRGKQEEVETYRKSVEAHFDKTATLFVSMAGSYKELFEHLSSGYETLSTGSARTLFKQRVDALLLGGAREEGNRLLGAGAAATTAAAATAAAADELANADTVLASDGPPSAAAGAREATAGEASGSPAEEKPAADAPAQRDAAAARAGEEGEDGATPDEASPAGAPPAAAAATETAADDADQIVRRAEGDGFDAAKDDAADDTARPASGGNPDPR